MFLNRVKNFFPKFFACLIFIITIIAGVLLTTPVFAQDAANIFPVKQAVIVNPIRGTDFWNYGHDLLETPKKQYEIISKNNLSATWLVRYDALKNPRVLEFLKSLNPNQEIGIFLEVTPSLASDSGVNYNKSPNWHYAKSVLVIGYQPDDRKKMIDQVVKMFKETLNRDPKSIGAWWIDAGSLLYLHDKYGIESNLDVSDQFSTDQYQVWGQYWSSPFYPSKLNALIPASGKDNKIGLLTIQWAPRDPFNGYGNGVFESTYSIQANDYLTHKLDSKYFKKLLDIYPETTVGMENDFSWVEFGGEYANQISIMSQRQKQNLLSIKTMSDFSSYYKSLYPDISPPLLIYANDPLGSDGKVVWYQTPRYRMGWFHGPYGSVIKDLRELNDGIEEQCLKTACESLKLGFNASQAIDEVNYRTKWVLDQGSITNFSINNIQKGIEFSYINQAGHKRVVQLLPNDIKVDDKINTISTAILAITASKNSPDQMQSSGVDFKSGFEWGKNITGLMINFVKFLSLVILFFLLPGLVLARRWLAAIPTGIAMFTLFAYILGYLHLDLGLWVIPVLSIGALVKYGVPNYEKKLNLDSAGWVLSGLIVVGSLSWLVTTIKNGLIYSYGMGYWGPNGHDAIWHLALVSELQRNFPPQNPVFAGIPLNNYHYFFDLLLAKSGFLLGINIQDLLFRFFPLLISVFIGVLAYQVVRKLVVIYKLGDEHFGKAAGIWVTFFVYFGGSFGWIISYLKDRSFGGETTFWAQQAVSTLLNPPFAISVMLLLAGLYLFYSWCHPRTEFGAGSETSPGHPELVSGSTKVGIYYDSGRFRNKSRMTLELISLVILFGTLIEFKVYAGVLVLIALGLLTAERMLKRDFSLLVLFIPTSLLSAAVFLPNNMGSQSLLEFSPFWLIYSMITFQDRLGWNRLSFTLQSGKPLKLVYGYGLGFLVFLVGNLGTRVVFLGNIRNLFKERFLLWIAVFGILLPLVFIQKGNSWNIVQFFYYSMIVFDVLAGISLARIYQKSGPKIGTALIISVVLFTLPTTWNNLGQYLPDRPPARLSQDELEGMDFLKTQEQGTVITVPFDEKFRSNFSEPLPLAAYTSTAYVSAFSNHPTFFEDTINLEIIGVDYNARLNTARDFTKILDHSSQILKENNIKYFYMLKKSNINVDEGRMGLKTIFENDEVKIFKST